MDRWFMNQRNMFLSTVVPVSYTIPKLKFSSFNTCQCLCNNADAIVVAMCVLLHAKKGHLSLHCALHDTALLAIQRYLEIRNFNWSCGGNNWDIGWITHGNHYPDSQRSWTQCVLGIVEPNKNWSKSDLKTGLTFLGINKVQQ